MLFLIDVCIALSAVIGRICLNDFEQTATIHFPEIIPKGKGNLFISFTGSLNDKMIGFYRTVSRSSSDGQPKTTALTQFEMTHARMAFPCWDEPSVKATFQLTVIAPKFSTTLSNTESVEEVAINDKQKRVKFGRTPKMSTYLLALVISELDGYSKKSSDGHQVRVFTSRGRKDEGRFALSVATRCINFYRKQFETKYPLSKLDMVAVNNFAFGAMENWGLITFKDKNLLVTNRTTLIQKQKVALDVAHEIAHQWFGNLVTMEWWTYLWLSEGFATFMEYVTVDFIFPDWRIWEQFLADDEQGMQHAMFRDALKHTLPIEVPVIDPHEIDYIFDDITYLKGCALMRMLNWWIGEDVGFTTLYYFMQLRF